MTKLRPYLFFLLILAVGLFVGVFKIYNTQRVNIDTLFGSETYEWSLGDAMVLAWAIGFGTGIVLMAVHLIIQKIDNRSLQRHVKSLEKQLEKAHEVAKRETTKH